MEPDPLGTKQEPEHLGGDGTGEGALPSDAMQAEEITARWLSSVLDGDVGSVRQESIGDGLVGMNLRLFLTQAVSELPTSVVAKLPSLDPTSRATGIALRNYEREVKFYSHVAGPVDHARLAVTALAQLHGPRWNDPSLDDLEWLERRRGSDAGAQLATLWQMFIGGFLRTYGQFLTAEQHELVEKFGPLIPEWVDGRDGPETVTHGDYRLDNMLFGTDDAGPPITVVDWQTPAHASPATDLSYFCGAGLLRPERREHERELVDLYVTSLSEYEVQVDESWLWEHYRRDAFAGVVMAVVASQVVGSSERSEAMFSAMATRHLQHALDVNALGLI